MANYQGPGSYLGGGNKLAQLLMNQPDPNNGTMAGGMGSVLQKALMGLMMGREQRGVDQAKDVMSQAMQAMQGSPASTIQWNQPTRPDGTGSPTTPVAAVAPNRQLAMSLLASNERTAPMAFQMQASQMEREAALAQAQQMAAAQHQNALALKAAPGWEKPPTPIPGRDVPYSPDVERQLVGIAGARATAAQQPPAGYAPAPGGGLAAIPGGPQDPATIAALEQAKRDAARAADQSKPLPPTALKMQQEHIDALKTAENIAVDLSAVDKMIEGGQLNLSLLGNAVGGVKNYLGMSDESSRNLATFQSTLEKLRNDSLRLNNGVQTEGDAQRAWNELFKSINDKGLVKQRLAEIAAINRRAADIRKYQIDVIRQNFGKGPLEDVPESAPVIGRGASPGGWSITKVP